VHDSEEDGREQDHWNANGDEVNQVHSDSRSPMRDTIDKLTEPTRAAFWMALGVMWSSHRRKSSHFKRLAIQYWCRMGMLWCNLIICVPMRVTTLYLYQLMGVTGSRGTTSDGGTAAQCQQEKAQQQ
jgi:hypothetical protein